MGARRGIRDTVGDTCSEAAGVIWASVMKLNNFWLIIAVVFLAGIGFTVVADNEFYFYTTYAVMQLMIMGIAWNILGGFTGYVNFGSGGFFAAGAYTTVFLHRLFDGPPLLIAVLVAPIVCGLIGLAVGYFTLRYKGVYFAIATLAVAIILETVVINWEFVGGAGGYYLLIPENIVFFDSYIMAVYVDSCNHTYRHRSFSLPELIEDWPRISCNTR